MIPTSRCFIAGICLLAFSAHFSEAQKELRPKPVEARKQTFKGEAGVELPYLWLPPQKIKPDERYPLVVCLHGAGGNSWASGVLELPKMRQAYPCFVMTPKCEKSEGWAITEVLPRGTNRKEKLPLVVEAIREVARVHPIDVDRIYVTGQSLGGVGTWAALARHRDVFAAGVPICGAWRLEDAKLLTAVPVWAFHGENDATVPPKWSRELCAAITKAGGTAKYTEYPGVGHGSWSKAYAEAELWEWLFKQRRKGR